ncbi:MAG: hypothetical protein IT195_11240 [Microthrixaceae bacterium]|nr:hypothetical protein [Microthrixaceae bacterium]
MNMLTRSDVVTIEVPAEHSFLRVLRVAISSLAADLGFDIEEVESARAAVDELASVLIRAAEPRQAITVEISSGEGRLQVSGQVEQVRAIAPLDPLISAVLDASTTAWCCDGTAGSAGFEFTCVHGCIGARA